MYSLTIVLSLNIQCLSNRFAPAIVTVFIISPVNKLFRCIQYTYATMTSLHFLLYGRYSVLIENRLYFYGVSDCCLTPTQPFAIWPEQVNFE
jgi:hypothetical protein